MTRGEGRSEWDASTGREGFSVRSLAHLSFSILVPGACRLRRAPRSTRGSSRSTPSPPSGVGTAREGMGATTTRQAPPPGLPQQKGLQLRAPAAPHVPLALRSCDYRDPWSVRTTLRAGVPSAGGSRWSVSFEPIFICSPIRSYGLFCRQPLKE